MVPTKVKEPEARGQLPEKFELGLEGGKKRYEIASDLGNLIGEQLKGKNAVFDVDEFKDRLCKKDIDSDVLFGIYYTVKGEFVKAASDLIASGTSPEAINRLIAAMSREGSVPQPLKPVLIVSGIEEMGKPQPLPSSPEDWVSRFALQYRINPSGCASGAFMAICKEESAILDLRKEPRIIAIGKKIADRLEEIDQTAADMFVNNFAPKFFNPALQKLDPATLDEFTKGEFADLYARLHAAFLARSGFGGPANAIDTASRIGPKSDPKAMFQTILLSLYDLYSQLVKVDTDSEKVRISTDSANMSKIVQKWAASPKGCETEMEKLRLGLKIRDNIAGAIQNDVSKKAFVNELSVRVLIPALRTLDRKVLEELAETTKGSIGAEYTRYHALVLDKGGHGIPAKLIEYTGANSHLPYGLQAPAIAAVLKSVSELGADLWEGDARNSTVAQCTKEILQLKVSASNDGDEAVRARLFRHLGLPLPARTEE